MIINRAVLTAPATSSATVKASGKDTEGRNLRCSRRESSSFASSGLRARIVTGILFRAKRMPRVVPQVVVPTTATFVLNLITPQTPMSPWRHRLLIPWNTDFLTLALQQTCYSILAAGAPKRRSVPCNSR
jgi:hypothetical protein